MKKIVYIIVGGITILGIIRFYIVSQIGKTYYKSPNGMYTLIVSSKRGVLDMTMPGDGGSGSGIALIKLLDKNGKVISTSNSEPDSVVFINSIQVDWDFENNEVIYARARLINLKTGKFL